MLAARAQVAGRLQLLKAQRFLGGWFPHQNDPLSKKEPTGTLIGRSLHERQPDEPAEEQARQGRTERSVLGT
jgi:hypothetical protein